jgi:hemoglobin-like flavoprotein
MDISESVREVMNSKELVGEAFYDHFFQRYPEMQQFFEKSDMRRQTLVLTMALMLVERYYITSFIATERFLQYLGTQHQARSIPRDRYPDWINTMLITLEHFHGMAWDEDLARQWREALEKAVNKMLEGYEERYGI